MSMAKIQIEIMEVKNMTQKFNFFLNEFVNDLDIRHIDENDHNIILNGIFLTKINNF